jgi:hypothetical protein
MLAGAPARQQFSFASANPTQRFTVMTARPRAAIPSG